MWRTLRAMFLDGAQAHAVELPELETMHVNHPVRRLASPVMHNACSHGGAVFLERQRHFEAPLPVDPVLTAQGRAMSMQVGDHAVIQHRAPAVSSRGPRLDRQRIGDTSVPAPLAPASPTQRHVSDDNNSQYCIQDAHTDAPAFAAHTLPPSRAHRVPKTTEPVATEIRGAHTVERAQSLPIRLSLPSCTDRSATTTPAIEQRSPTITSRLEITLPSTLTSSPSTSVPWLFTLRASTERGPIRTEPVAITSSSSVLSAGISRSPSTLRVRAVTIASALRSV